MTINQYLGRIEYLKHKSERKYERYMRLSESACSPRSSMNYDDMPHQRSAENSRELLLIRTASALDDYLKSREEYDRYLSEFRDALELLPMDEANALEIVYVETIGRPLEQRVNGVCRVLDLRRREQIPKAMGRCKKHLRSVLIEQGIDIE